jgi:predicted NAD/FAD-dependent oxidoreductase
MCTDDTIQRYAFLKAFGEGNSSLGQIDVLSKLKQISAEFFGSAYYVSSPVNFDELFEIATRDGLIERATPVSWRITDTGLRQRAYQRERYIKSSGMLLTPELS